MLLNCHTYYSFRYGTFAPRELMEEIRRKGYKVFALTDINNTSACLDVLRTAGEFGLRPVVGVDFRDGVTQKWIGLARNNEGFAELNRYLSELLHEGRAPENQAPEFSDVHIVYPVHQYDGSPLRKNEWLGVRPADLRNLPFSPYRHMRQRMVLLQSVSFRDKLSFNMHRLLRATGLNTLLSRLDPAEQAHPGDMLPARDELARQFMELPFAIRNTEALLNDCHVYFDYGKLSNKNLKHYTGSAEGDMELLKQQCLEGLQYRYKKPSSEVRERLEKELDVIGQMEFASYYLINWDIVRYAGSRGYYYVGRGSGANSLLAYLLRITDVDPVQLDLYFERFINIYRNNAPDFDMDFSWTDRDDITRYIFDRFGRERTALLGAYNTFQHDAVLRELGKVFGLPPDDIDRLQRSREPKDPAGIEKLVLRYGELLKGFPSHLSIHSSGILISEKPIVCYSATFLPPKGYPTTQFSMVEAEDIGLYKFDILSQRGLGKIKDCQEMIRVNRNECVDIHDSEKIMQDEAVRSLLRTGRTIGCFYVESPAMRMLLTKLGADDYLRLVAASSIIRPGVARSGMMRAYIDRYRNPVLREKARQEIPELYDILEETYGVMVYQEDVIRVAHSFAGLSLAQADYLRRGMSWKFRQRNEFSLVRDSFFNNCEKKGYQRTVVDQIWMQIESFANYAFSKGHSASYAVESFQALYLKAHYPVEYMAATINNGGGFYRKELYVHEARRHGADFAYPCVNKSGVLCRVEGNLIRPGLSMIAGLEESSVISILEERRLAGPFEDLSDLVRRTQLGLEQYRLLVRANALSFTGKEKRELLWAVHGLCSSSGKQTSARNELFRPVAKKWKMPELHRSEVEDAYDELELFGFTYRSPFELLREPAEPGVPAGGLKAYIGKEVRVTGHLVAYKYTSTAKGEKMFFGTFLDEHGDWLDTVHFPPSASAYPFKGRGCYELTGVVTEEYDFICIDVQRMKHLPMLERE